MRNWTRRSIEELVRQYIIEHGGGGGEHADANGFRSFNTYCDAYTGGNNIGSFKSSKDGFGTYDILMLKGQTYAKYFWTDWNYSTDAIRVTSENHDTYQNESERDMPTGIEGPWGGKVPELYYIADIGAGELQIEMKAYDRIYFYTGSGQNIQLHYLSREIIEAHALQNKHIMIANGNVAPGQPLKFRLQQTFFNELESILNDISGLNKQYVFIVRIQNVEESSVSFEDLPSYFDGAIEYNI